MTYEGKSRKVTPMQDIAHLPHQFAPEDMAHVQLTWPLRGRHTAHGPDHWTRVLNNAMILAERECLFGAEGALYLAALFHDSMRVDEHEDAGHGGRGAVRLHTVLGGMVRGRPKPWVGVGRVALECCALHTDLMPWNCGEMTAHLTVAEQKVVRVFCDADRLDLTRFGWRPDPARLFTDTAIEAVGAWEDEHRNSNWHRATLLG